LLVLSSGSQPVATVAFSPDGRRLVSASADNDARIWNANVPALDTQIEWALAAQFDPPSSNERLQLGLPTPRDVRQWPAAASACDQSAAAPYDPDRRAAGVGLDQIVVDIALPACAKEAQASGRNSRAVYQYGRTLIANADFAAAKRAFEDAVAGGHRAAQVDLGTLVSQPSAHVLDSSKAISLYEQAWRDGVSIGAFELGSLYEHGVDGLLAPDLSRAWRWYQKGAEAGEPNALARLAEREGGAASNTRTLDSFKYYAAAAESARREDWPDEAWRNWRYRRASLARQLAREGMMPEVANTYEHATTPAARTMWERLASLIGVN
jgi:TPR repeat protein